MAEIGKSVLTVLGIGVLMVGLAGCEQKKEGPAERAGKEIDKAVEKTGQQIEKVGKKIEDTATGSTKK